jgi:hypothetical protein
MVILALQLLLLLVGSSAAAVTISNVQPRLDQHGSILELGDGSIAKFGDKYLSLWCEVRLYSLPAHTQIL